MDLSTNRSFPRHGTSARLEKTVQILWIFIGSALAAFSVYVGTAAADIHPQAYPFVTSQFAAGFIYLSAVFLVLRRSESVSVNYIVLVGAACRLILLPSHPLLDNSIYSLANSIGLQLIIVLKSAVFLLDIANMLLIISILGKLRLPKSLVMIYAWCPLAIKEFANSGHTEPLMLFFLLLALLLWLKSGRTRQWAGFGLAMAIVANFAAAILIPIACKLGRWRSMAIFAILACVCVLTHKYGMFSLPVPDTYYAFNDGAFRLLRWIESALYPDASNLFITPARLTAAVLIGSYSVYSASTLNKWDRIGTIVAIRNVLAVCILLMPSVTPWHVCWMLPFLCISPSPALILFTVTCNLSYIYYAEGFLPAWVPVIEYAPVYAMLLFEYITHRPTPKPTKIFMLNCDDE